MYVQLHIANIVVVFCVHALVVTNGGKSKVMRFDILCVGTYWYVGVVSPYKIIDYVK